MKLDVKAFALTCGIVWGIGLFILTWWIILFHGATDQLTFIGRVYIGYRITPLGSVIGLAWAFVDGLIGGAIFAWLYNLFAKSS
ncbi:MAG: hypothetical protein DRG20_06460 [Deltaproteobacteria bacterium]|nr:MAG: hypothetical protein DRG20_06460 [Deltaproteobacteria bacterium]